jgi:hypothetical protein
MWTVPFGGIGDVEVGADRDRGEGVGWLLPVDRERALVVVFVPAHDEVDAGLVPSSRPGTRHARKLVGAHGKCGPGLKNRDVDQ